MRERSETLPIFLLADRNSAATIPLDAMQKSDDFIWLLEDLSLIHISEPTRQEGIGFCGVWLKKKKWG
ncbi:Orn/Lys/Arg decarboxylase N-terminal domain-containing protein, partial [Pseudomonas sp. RTB3]|uniref:Orn/Lys/Arg decarboxylase N-terminal domain-containing protein n=1 Tax=Pseudomonas sp. RTB3 TaxID=3048633 RepID=UPI002B22D07F